jgi:hypothetical protein
LYSRTRLPSLRRVATIDPTDLKRASASRPSGEWSDDDYDVPADGTVVGRIMKAAAAPEGTPWLFDQPVP